MRALLFTQTGQPSAVLAARSWPSLPPPGPGSLLVRFLLAPVHPADINVVQGVYPARPPRRENDYYIPGNEGLAEVIAAGPDTPPHLAPGVRLIMKRPQLGTWASHSLLHHTDVLPLPPRAASLSAAQCATMSVVPPTALRMLADFTPLQPGDWILQNAANSAVGKAVIQIARHKGYKTINFVRDRPTMRALSGQLRQLGADHVFTYDDLGDGGFKQKIIDLSARANIRLGLNCVGGTSTARMASLLGTNAHLVSYGAMSKQPLTLSTSMLIFKNLTCHGYWQSRWYAECSNEQRDILVQELVDLMLRGILQEEEQEICFLTGSDKEATAQAKGLMHRIESRQHAGPTSKKILLSWAEPSTAILK